MKTVYNHHLTGHLCLTILVSYMTTELAINVTDLTKNFKDKLAVDSLNLNVKSGEIYAFLGPNGAGKSTSIKMLITLLKPDGGSISIFNYDAIKDTGKVRLQLGVALQETSLDLSQTGVEFLELQGALYGLSKQEVSQRIKQLLPLIDIGDDIQKQIKTYSGGMKRRLDLAAAIIHNPKILFLDEPTTGLDPISRNKVWSEIKRLNEELGMTIFLTTQYLEEADQLADRVGIINKGKLIIEGTPKDLKQSIGKDVIIVHTKNLTNETLIKLKKNLNEDSIEYKDSELRIATKDGSKLVSNLVIQLNKYNQNISNLTLRTTTLDDVFLEVTGDTFTN
jgi:ABC-2 type transport system ATP-binding protein